MSQQWMIYGATGYSGSLIAKAAKQAGLTPTLAGRSKEKVKRLADELGLPWCCFSLDDAKNAKAKLDSMTLMLNCAGPFSQTAEHAMSACLASKTHYLDITGEIAVFELASGLSDKARQAGVLLCPGVGFDVIPTDCVAATLKQALPDAERLHLGFDSKSRLSPGTAKTSVEGLKMGGKVRENSEIKAVPFAYRTRQVDFGDGQKLAMTIPWGDVSTAYHTTRIPNIEVYVPASPRLVKRMKKLNWVRPVLGWSWVQKRLKAQIDKKVTGPSVAAREESPMYVWGEATNAKGDKVQARVKTPNGYTVTQDGALAVVQYVLNTPDTGYHTPASLVGAELLSQLPGCGAIETHRI